MVTTHTLLTNNNSSPWHYPIMLDSGGSSSPFYDSTGFSSNNSSLTSGSPPNNSSWMFTSQSIYTSLSPPPSGVDSILSDQVFPFVLSSNDSLPLSISQLTGIPFKQMAHPHAARYAGGAALSLSPVSSTTARRPPYTLMAGAPGSPIGSSSQALTLAQAQVNAANGNSTAVKNPKLYKTELCRSWMDQGRCNYGERCQYAHGEHEKRSVPRHPKYKTEMCQSFHKSGYCPYGARCHFIHSESEMIANVSQSAAASAALQAAVISPQLAVMPRAVAPPTQLLGQSLAPGAPLNSRIGMGYGSAGESPAGSSADSGSESPNGSFSPGLELEDVNSLSNVFGLSTLSQKSTPTHQTQRFGPGTGGFTDSFPGADSKINGLVGEFMAWNFQEKFDETPGRLPVFAQLSNPPQ